MKYVMKWLSLLLKSRNLLILGFLVMAGLAVWSFWGQPPPPPPEPPPQAAPPAHPQMKSLSLTEVDDGGKRWVLEAKSADYLKDRNEIRISDIYLEFFGEDGRVIHLSCEAGLIHTKTRSLTLKGQVVLKEGDLSIETELVHYEPKERLLLAPEEVTLESERLKVKGKGLRVELAKKRLTLIDHYLTEVKTKEGKRPW